MEQRPVSDQDPYQERTEHYKSQLFVLEQECGVPDGIITEDMRQVGAEMLLEVYKKYGDPNSETYMLYHNDEHTLSVLGRCWVQASLRKKEFPEEFSDKDYILGMFGALGHDIARMTGGPPGEDERQSARKTTSDYMRRLGFSEEDCRRVREMIMTTEVTTENGVVVQTNIQKGSTDKLKLELAIADINGIAMEGIDRMIEDAFNLCLEVNGVSPDDMLANIDTIEKFFTMQAKFIEKRLDSLDGDFEYYYGGKAVHMREVYERAFTGATRHAKGAAHVLYRFPVIRQNSIRDALEQANAYVGTAAEKLFIAKKVLAAWLTRLTPDEAAAQV